MDKIKPYMFYIVCGVVLLILLVIMAVFGPSHAEAEGATVEDTKVAADQAFNTKLTKNSPPLGLKSRAENTIKRNGGLIPETPRKPENPAHVAEILDNYIIHEEWTNKFDSVVKDYKNQLNGIGKNLAERSEVLGVPVSENTDPGTWYNAYLEQSVRLLTTAIEGAALVEPAKPAAGNTGLRRPGFGGFGGTRPGTRPTTPAAAADAEPKEWTRAQLEEYAALRSVLGLYSKVGDFPQATEHAHLTTELRIAAAALDAVLRAEGEPMVNPNPVEIEGLTIRQPSEMARAKIVSLSFGDSMPSRMNGGELKPFELKLRGSPAALLAALGRLDGISTPVVVRLGSSWKQSGAATVRNFGARGATAGSAVDVTATDSVMEVSVSA
nr:hypothetical protein [Planctomycetota bacterium]